MLFRSASSSFSRHVICSIRNKACACRAEEVNIAWVKNITLFDNLIECGDSLGVLLVPQINLSKKCIGSTLRYLTYLCARSLFLDAGMNDFVPKPIDVKDLITKVKKWLPDDKIMENDGTEADPGSEYGTDENWIRCEGLDVETAVRALGSTALYDKIASEYYRSGAEKHDGIMAAYANEDWNDYTIRVHALKSSSRQIGAMELGSMAETMEKAGKAGDIDAIRAGNSQTMVKFLKLLSDLSEYYGVEEDDSDKSPIEAEVLGGMLDELAAACDDLDMDGMESVSDRLKQYSYDEDVRPVIDDLLKAIGDMDTDACMEIADKLR